MNYLDEINNGLFKESEHKNKNEYSSSSGSTWFILVEQNSKVPVSRIVLNNQGPTFILYDFQANEKVF